ncbi:MAG: hypothetical protein R3A79_17025 [Nannocystaceae bacterium]
MTPKTASKTIKKTNTSRKKRPHRREEIEGADAPTLDDFWPRFEDGYLRQMKPSTRRGYDSIYRNYLRPVLGEVRSTPSAAASSPSCASASRG